MSNPNHVFLLSFHTAPTLALVALVAPYLRLLAAVVKSRFGSRAAVPPPTPPALVNLLSSVNRGAGVFAASTTASPTSASISALRRDELVLILDYLPLRDFLLVAMAYMVYGSDNLWCFILLGNRLLSLSNVKINLFL